MEQWNQIFAADSEQVIEIDNHSPASVEEAEVEVKVQDVWEE